MEANNQSKEVDFLATRQQPRPIPHLQEVACSVVIRLKHKEEAYLAIANQLQLHSNPLKLEGYLVIMLLLRHRLDYLEVLLQPPQPEEGSLEAALLLPTLHQQLVEDFLDNQLLIQEPQQLVVFLAVMQVLLPTPHLKEGCLVALLLPTLHQLKEEVCSGSQLIL